MRIFVVTGCNGYIGSHMCYELKKEYPRCLIYGIDFHEKPHIRPLYDVYINSNLVMDTINIPYGVHAVFHFAAYTSVEEGEQQPLKYYQNNVVGSLRTVKAALMAKVPNFIFSSTAAVYGENSSCSLSEKLTMNAVSVYGKTKQMVENKLSHIEEMNIIRLRYFNACGRNVEANLHEEHDPETHLIPLLARNKKATIYGNDWETPDGTCVRDYVHVVDICQAHIKAFRFMENEKVGTINCSLNVGSGKGYSVKEVVDKVDKIVHNNTMIKEYLPRRKGDVPYLVADTSLIKEMLNFETKYDLNAIIESMKNV